MADLRTLDQPLEQGGGIEFAKTLGSRIAEDLSAPLADEDRYSLRTTSRHTLDDGAQMRRPDAANRQLADLGKNVLLKVVGDLVVWGTVLERIRHER